MMKIPIITQNFSSPDAFTDTPLMLLPQAALPPVPDRDQEGFSQLLLHDLHRHRQSYVRSYTAFETLKKRQDFVLRQENLRSLLNLEQRVHTKQEQLIDQSIHSYEQCFVKVINGNLTPHGSLQEQPRRVRSAASSFGKVHLHHLSPINITSPDVPPISPFQRYQKSHRPPKYRSPTSLRHSAQAFHDAFNSSNFSNQNQPFVTFTEGYMQKYGDRPTNRYHLSEDNDEMDEIREIGEGDDDDDDEEEELNFQQIRSVSVEPQLMGISNKKQEQKSKSTDLQQMRATISSRNTNTPASTPQMGYNDAVRDGLITLNDNQNQNNPNHLNTKPPIRVEKDRSSQQPTSQNSRSGSKTSTKRPKTASKKKQSGVGLTSEKKSDLTTTDNDLLKSAMFVQNYETTSNTTIPNVPAQVAERTQIPVNINRRTPSVQRRASVKSNDSPLGTKPALGEIATQMTATGTAAKTVSPLEQSKIEGNSEENLLSTTNGISGSKQDSTEPIGDSQPRLEVVDNRKRVKKGAFDPSDSVNDFVSFELGLMGNRSAMKRNRVHFGKENNQTSEQTEAIPDNQGTLDLLEKIRQSATGLSVGQSPLSQQGCRFELPQDLKLLENLTPLEYLSKYCRLSPRRHYQFKRIFDKYRNNQYRFESSHLYTSIVDVHSESFTRAQYDHLCQLIDLGNEQYQFTFDTLSGILALCERILYSSSTFRTGGDEYDLAKDTLERCDFDSLERKLDGLNLNETMKRLLKSL